MVRSPTIKPLVSVVLPVYNGARFLPQAVESVLGQTWKKFELLVVDDASTDATSKILRQVKDARVRIFKSASHKGVAASLNLALKKARGRYIARMDADDVVEKDRLEKQIRFLQTHPAVGVVGSWVKLIDYKGRVKGYKKYPVADQEIKKKLHYLNPLIHPSVMIRKELFDKYGGYDEELDGAEDYDLWCRFVPYTQFANLDHLLLQYRLHSKNVSFVETSRLNIAYTKVQVKKIFSYGYPAWEIVFGLKSLLFALTPRPVKQWIYRNFFNY